MLDMEKLLMDTMARDRKVPDGKLHPSSHIMPWQLRHTQIEMKLIDDLGPEDYDKFYGSSDDMVSDIRMATGTMWHEYLQFMVQETGTPHMSEVNLSPWMGSYWSGTADLLLWDSEYQAFTLWDYKTCKGSAIPYLAQNGAKEEHKWQTSVYLEAVIQSGIPVVTDHINIWYIPMDSDKGAKPLLCDIRPFIHGMVVNRKMEIEGRVNAYLNGEEGLAPFPPMTEKLMKVPGSKTSYYVHMVPHWSCAFCKFGDLCGCSKQEKKLMGKFVGDKFMPSKGNELFVPTTRNPNL